MSSKGSLLDITSPLEQCSRPRPFVRLADSVRLGVAHFPAAARDLSVTEVCTQSGTKTAEFVIGLWSESRTPFLARASTVGDAFVGDLIGAHPWRTNQGLKDKLLFGPDSVRAEARIGEMKHEWSGWGQR